MIYKNRFHLGISRFGNYYLFYFTLAIDTTFQNGIQNGLSISDIEITQCFGDDESAAFLGIGRDSEMKE